jgi:hypothetical protein
MVVGCGKSGIATIVLLKRFYPNIRILAIDNNPCNIAMANQWLQPNGRHTSCMAIIANSI